MNFSQIAMVCHAANRQYQLLINDPNPSPEWDDCLPEIRESVRHGVKAIVEDPEVTPLELHARWCEFKRTHGWKYGEVKDEDAKTHPCLVPYGDLPESQRKKDYLFRNIVLALMG